MLRQVLFVVICILPMALSYSAARMTNSNEQFKRDRRAIRARTMATGEDHVAHASIKMKMMNEGRARRAVSPARVKRFISPAAGTLPKSATRDSWKAVGEGWKEPIRTSSTGASVAALVDRIQHGQSLSASQAGPRLPANAVYRDLLTRNRKDGRSSIPSGRIQQKPKQNDEVDDFVEFMRELGIFSADGAGRGFGDSGPAWSSEEEGPSSAMDYISRHLKHKTPSDSKSRPSLTGRDRVKDNDRQSSKAVTVDLQPEKRDSFIPVDRTDDEKDIGLDEGETNVVKEEAVINVRPDVLDVGDKQDLTVVNLEIIKNLLEQIVARSSSR